MDGRVSGIVGFYHFCADSVWDRGDGGMGATALVHVGPRDSVGSLGVVKRFVDRGLDSGIVFCVMAAFSQTTGCTQRHVYALEFGGE